MLQFADSDDSRSLTNKLDRLLSPEPQTLEQAEVESSLGSNRLPINPEMLARFHEHYTSDPVAQATGESIIKFGRDATMHLPYRDYLNDGEFSHVIKSEGVLTAQNKTGRCWMFASLNMLRSGVLESLKIKSDFSFSTTYLYFYDKLERSNFFLDNVIERADKALTEPDVSKRVKDPNPEYDGGGWIWFKNLVNKYGLMPAGIIEGSKSTEDSKALNYDLGFYLRQCAKELRDAYQANPSKEALYEMKEGMLANVYKMLAMHFGEPPQTFSWRYRNQRDKLKEMNDLTPKQFCEEVCGIDLDQYVKIHVHALDEFPDYQSYEVKNFEIGNVSEGEPMRFIKLPVRELKSCLMNAIRQNRPSAIAVHMQDYDRERGIMDLRDYDFERTYRIPATMTQSDRIRYGGLGMNHLMIVTGYHDKFGTGMVEKWRIQNSWGEENGKKGYFTATDAWFDLNLLEGVVHRDALTPEALAAMETQPLKLDLQKEGHRPIIYGLKS